MAGIASKMSDLEKTVYERHRNTFPFPIVEFATEIGLKVFIADDLPDSLSGAISKVGTDYHIIVNGSHSEKRMRFTLAHEIGHYFNDRDYLDKTGEIVDQSKQSKRWLFRHKNTNSPHDPKMAKMDARANRFAADLLMPMDVFIEQWEQARTPEEVADYFNVSPDAARVRAAVLLGEIV